MKFLYAVAVILLALGFVFLADLGFAWFFAKTINHAFSLHLHAGHLFPVVVVSSAFISACTYSKGTSKK